MITRADVLQTLDRHAANFDFPGFSNEQYETADARMHLFRDDARWAVVVEELVDWPAAQGLMTIVFAMGDIAGEMLTTHTPVETEFEEDDEGAPVAPEQIVVRGEAFDIHRDAVEADCEEHELEATFAALLQLIEADRDRLFSTPPQLADVVAAGLPHIMTIDAWAHPDVYGGPKPSESAAFQQVADVLETGDTSKWAPTEEPNNRDWKFWLQSR